jgi:CTD small phosphatase-like protein 2
MLPIVKQHDAAYKKKDSIFLPEYRHGIKKTLILDIDETMIHCLDDPYAVSDVIIKIPIDEEYSEFVDAGLNIRPHLHDCLIQCKENFQIIAFTASDQQYADAILDFIDPDHNIFEARLYRQHCIEIFNSFGRIK